MLYYTVTKVLSNCLRHVFIQTLNTPRCLSDKSRACVSLLHIQKFCWFIFINFRYWWFLTFTVPVGLLQPWLLLVSFWVLLIHLYFQLGSYCIDLPWMSFKNSFKYQKNLKTYFLHFWYEWCLFFFFSFIFISWRIITSQHFSGFCHTWTWISHGVTCIPHPDHPSHLPLTRFLWVFPVHQPWALVSCIPPGLVICLRDVL